MILILPSLYRIFITLPPFIILSLLPFALSHFSLHLLRPALLFVCLVCLSSPTFCSSSPWTCSMERGAVHQPGSPSQPPVLSVASCKAQLCRKKKSALHWFFSPLLSFFFSFFYVLGKEKASLQHPLIYIPQPRKQSAIRAGSWFWWKEERLQKTSFLGQNCSVSPLRGAG